MGLGKTFLIAALACSLASTAADDISFVPDLKLPISRRWPLSKIGKAYKDPCLESWSNDETEGYPCPTASPTTVPTSVPTEVPTEVPTKVPTTIPTKLPTALPTKNPTELPTKNPTKNPTVTPTGSPTMTPTDSPTVAPTMFPTVTLAPATWASCGADEETAAGNGDAVETIFTYYYNVEGTAGNPSEFLAELEHQLLQGVARDLLDCAGNARKERRNLRPNVEHAQRRRLAATGISSDPLDDVFPEGNFDLSS